MHVASLITFGFKYPTTKKKKKKNAFFSQSDVLMYKLKGNSLKLKHNKIPKREDASPVCQIPV